MEIQMQLLAARPHHPTPFRPALLPTLLAAASLALPIAAGAEVRGLTGLFLEDGPTSDLDADDFAGVPNGFIQPNFSPAPDVAQSTLLMTGFTTDVSSVTSVAGPTAVTGLRTFPLGLEPPPGDVLRNVWGFQGPEIPGADSILGTNVGAGLDNAGASGDPLNPVQPFDVFFGTNVFGAPGPANDFFLIDIIGDDAVLLQPLAEDGTLIGDYSLTLASGPGPNNFGNADLGDFGLTGFDLALFLENGANIGLPEEIVIDDVPLAGIAWDLEDFEGTVADPLTSLAGLRITGLDLPEEISSGQGSIDLIAIGYNTVPEPGTGVLLGLGLAGLARAGRRRQAPEAGTHAAS